MPQWAEVRSGCRRVSRCVVLSLVVLVGSACQSSDGPQTEAASRRVERDVIELAQASSKRIAISDARYSCDPSDPAGGTLFADSDGGERAPAILDTLAIKARDQGWAVDRDSEALVLRKRAEGKDFVVTAPGAGTQIEPDSDLLLIAWNMDRDDC